MLLTVYHDLPESEACLARFRKQAVLAGLEALDSRIRRKGLASLDASRSLLVAIGTENDGCRVTKSGYGVFNLSWQARQHPEWASQIEAELDEIRRQIRDRHKAPLQYLIWAGMGGSAEDKSMFQACGLLKRGVRCYVLDSTDPAKLKYILEDIARRGRRPLRELLRRTLVVGMAMGMTSYEPVANLEKLAALYDKLKIDSRPNFLYLTLSGSLLDQFAKGRGYRRVELQLNDDNTVAGRHSGPLTRGSLYPLGLARVDLAAWIEAAALSGEDVDTAWRLASFLHAQGKVGRDKVTLVLPKTWTGADLWTKQDFEESLGKSEELGVKIVIGERIRMTNYRPPKDPRQDRVFLAFHIRGTGGEEQQKAGIVRRAGYPTAVVTLERGAVLSAYMQFIHYTVFGLAWLRGMNFVTQPGVELYKSIANRLHAEARQMGGIEKTREWQKMRDTPKRAAWRGGIVLRYDRLPASLAPEGSTAAAIYASFLQRLAGTRTVEYGELTFFGDMRYSPQGRALRAVLHRAAEQIFCSRLKMPADVYEGPAMNHSYHEMVIGHGRCFSTIILSEEAEQLAIVGDRPDYHRAQFLATQMALAERERPVVSLTLKDLRDRTLEALAEFFRQVANQLRRT